MLSQLALDENLIDIQTNFLMDDKLRIAKFYPKDSKSHLLCKVLNHDFFTCEEYEENQLSESITFCLRCKLQIIEKFLWYPIQLEPVEELR